MLQWLAMSTNANKAIVRRFYAEVIGAGDLSRVEALVAPDYLDHNAEGAGRGPAVLRAHIEAIWRTFPDFELQIDNMGVDPFSARKRS